MVKNNNSVKWLKGLLWLGFVYHVIISFLGMFAKDTVVTLAKVFYGFNLEITPQVLWILNPFGAYVLAFGAFMALLATDPVKYKKVIYVIPAFIAFRVIQRLYFIFVAPSGFMVGDPTKNLIDIALVVIYGGLVFWLAKKVK